MGEVLLVEAEQFAEAAFGPIAANGVADAAGSDDADASEVGGAIGAGEQVAIKKAALPADTGSADQRKVSGGAQVLLGAEPHGGGGQRRIKR